MNHKMTPIAEIDDLVRITGYENRVFRIASFTHELTHECVTNGEFALGAQEDITIVSKADTAERYLETFEHPEVSDVSPMDIFELLGTEEIPMTKKSDKKPRKPSKQERIDALLDERINVTTAIKEIGDADGYYQRRIDEIEAELKEVYAE